MTGTNKSLRHVEALVNDFMAQGDLEHLFRRGFDAMLAALMEVEVSQQIGAEHGQRTDQRTTQRNGYRNRTLETGLGTSTLQIPKLRHGTYFPSFLTAFKRSDDALILAVATCYQQGVSTRNVQAVARALGIENLGKDKVSAMARALDPQVQAFRTRPLHDFPYVFVDARYENLREEHRVHKVAVMVAIGVRRDGHREVLGYAVHRTENQPYWSDFFTDLLNRGLSGVKLVVSDAHEGLRRALQQRFPGAKWQRCRVHFMRNLGQRVAKRHQAAFLALAKTIFAQESYDEALKQRTVVADAYRKAGKPDVAAFLEGADEVLTYLQFPTEHWTKLHSTNVIERLNRELKRRTRVVSIFPDRASLERLVGALLLEEHEEWTISRRYISEGSMQSLYAPAQLGQTDDPTRQLAAK